MSDTDNSEKKDERKKKTDVAGKAVDAFAEMSIGLTKIATAPLKAVGKVIDETIDGARDGLEQSKTPLEKISKPVVGGMIGTLKGTIKGIEETSKVVGEGIAELGTNVSKVGKVIFPEEEGE